MNITIKKTSYNILAFLGWVSVVLALVTLIIVIFSDTERGYQGGIIGLLLGIYLILESGPLLIKQAAPPLDPQENDPSAT